MSPAEEPYTLLESVLIRYQELQDAGVPVEQRFPELKSHIVDLIDVVKDYQLLTLDQFIHAAFIAANNVQDVRLYSLEASLDTLKNPSVALGKLVLEIFIIATVEVVVVAVGSQLLIAAVPAVGMLLHRITRNRRVVKQIGENVADVEKAVTKRFDAAAATVEGWLDAPEPMGMYLSQPGAVASSGTPPPSVFEGFRITSPLKSGNVVTPQTKQSIATIAQARAERAFRIADPIVRSDLNKTSQEIYQRLHDLRAQDALANSLTALSDHVRANLEAQPAAAGTGAAKLTPSSAIVDFVSELQRMKTSLINDAAYSKSVVRRVFDETAFFQDIDVGGVLVELDDLYPRLIYAYDTLLTTTNEIADRIEIGIWYVYLKANNVLFVRDVAGEIASGSDGVFYNDSTLPTQEPDVFSMGREAASVRVTGHDFTGIKKLSEQQAQYLFTKFARPELEEIAKFLSPYVITDERMAVLMAPDLPKAVDLPEANFLGIRNTGRDAQVRLLKLAVIVFFLQLEARLAGKNVQSAQFGEEMVGQPFKQVLDLLKPPPAEPPPPAPATETPTDDPLKDTLKEMGFQTAEDVEPELLLLQAEIRLLRLAVEDESEWRLQTTAMCEEVRTLLGKVRNLELTTEQKDRLTALEDLYGNSICARVT